MGKMRVRENTGTGKCGYGKMRVRENAGTGKYGYGKIRVRGWLNFTVRESTGFLTLRNTGRSTGFWPGEKDWSKRKCFLYRPPSFMGVTLILNSGANGLVSVNWMHPDMSLETFAAAARIWSAWPGAATKTNTGHIFKRIQTCKIGQIQQFSYQVLYHTGRVPCESEILQIKAKKDLKSARICWTNWMGKIIWTFISPAKK